MRYCLVTLGAHKPVSIPKARYDSIVKAKAALLVCLFIEEKFDLVVENYLELEMALLECTLRYLAHPRLDSRRAATDRALFNRRLVNLLSSAVTYAKQVEERHAPAVLSPDDASVIKAAFSKQRGNRLGYRAMNLLRNHALHYDVPVHLVEYPVRHVERESGNVVAFTVSPCLRPSDLRLNTGFSRPVLRELEALGESVELKPLLREYVEGLWTVHAQMRELVAQSIRTWEATLELANKTFLAGGNDERSAFLLSAVALRDDGTEEASVHVTAPFNEYRRFLEAKNAGLDNLSLRYVTSETSDGKP